MRAERSLSKSDLCPVEAATRPSDGPAQTSIREMAPKFQRICRYSSCYPIFNYL